MERFTERPGKILTGLILAAASVFGQGYTISAKPGAVNYAEGKTFLNGDPLSDKSLKATFLNTNDSLSTENGKAEVLLTPGVFLRVGENTEIRMVSPSLTDTQVELLHGEIMIEASGLVKENHLQILDHGASISIIQNGLYRFTADNPPTAAVLAGKADVAYSDRKVGLKKGRETILASNLAVQKFDTKQEDDLYAWSNVRSEYDAASSYSVSRAASVNGFNNGAYGYGGYGYGNGVSPGWFWDSGFNSYAWLPGNGIFYSPFGYGFYSPGFVGYAPVVTTYVYRGGKPWRHPNGTSTTPVNVSAPGFTARVPVNVKNLPAIGNMAASPYANQQARMQTARAYAASNASSAPTSGGWHGGNGASSVSSRSSNPGGGFSGASSHMSSGGGFSGGAGAGGHSTGGGGRSK